MAREYGMSPGRSQAQYGHAGHAGKSPAQAHRDQRQGRDTPQAQQHITGGAAPPAAVTRVPDFVRQPVGPGTTFPDYRSTVPQGFLQGIGNKFRDFTIKMRGYNEDENRPNTQAEYEAARQNRINQKRIQNITSRDIPWREQTLQTLGNLGYQGDLSSSQIGSTPFDRYPPRVGTVVEDAAAGIRATDAAQDMIYPERRPFVPPASEYEGMFPRDVPASEYEGMFPREVPASEYEGMFPPKVGPTSKYDWIESETASYDKTPRKDYLDLSKSISSEDIGDLTRTGTWQDQMGGQLMGDFKGAKGTTWAEFMQDKSRNAMVRPGDKSWKDVYYRWLDINKMSQGGRVGYKTGGRVGILAAF